MLVYIYTVMSPQLISSLYRHLRRTRLYLTSPRGLEREGDEGGWRKGERVQVEKEGVVEVVEREREEVREKEEEERERGEVKMGCWRGKKKYKMR